MQIRRTARVIVGLTGVALVWYALTTGLLDPTRLRRKPSLVGRVTRDGGPVSATVELFRAPLPEPALAVDLALPFVEGEADERTSTGEDGGFRLTGVPAGRYEVRATGPEGYVARTFAIVDPEKPGPPVTLAIETGDESLVARATTADGKPFRGYVFAYTRADPGEPGGTWTGAVTPGEDGVFEIHGFPRDRVTLAFLVPGELRVTLPRVGMDGGSMIVDGGLVGRGGEVRDERGRPVAGVRVLVRSRDPLTGRAAVQAAVAGADGRFEARVLPEVVEWAATAEGRRDAVGDGWPVGGIVLGPAR